MTYDSWKATEPDREPAPGEHRPYADDDDCCGCDECEADRDRVMEPYVLADTKLREERHPMPPWFQRVLDTCESLSLDNARDRQILWERISEAWPKDAIEAMIADNIDHAVASDHERDVQRCTAAVIAALEES